MAHAIGVDIGGGSTKIGLVSKKGEILARARITAIPDESGDAFVERLVIAIRPLLSGQAVVLRRWPHLKRWTISPLNMRHHALTEPSLSRQDFREILPTQLH